MGSKHCFREGRALIRHGLTVSKAFAKSIREGHHAGLNAKKLLAELKSDLTNSRRDRCVAGTPWGVGERGWTTARAIYFEDLQWLKSSIRRAREAKSRIDQGKDVYYVRRSGPNFGRLRRKKRR